MACAWALLFLFSALDWGSFMLRRIEQEDGYEISTTQVEKPWGLKERKKLALREKYLGLRL
jgi:hypothetical protein